MSKLINVSQEQIDNMENEFREYLKTVKLTDTKVSFTRNLGECSRKAALHFTEIAWLKMTTLVREFDKEVAWHGVAFRDPDESKDDYYITDILIYPQEVTAATVNTDQEKYETWLMSQEDDVFNNIRMQGHSHVNMAVTPSSVDLEHQHRIIEQLTPEMFYIFLIWNKRGEKFIKIHDRKKNVIFETADTTVGLIEDGTGVVSFLRLAKEMVVNKTPTYTPGYYSSPAYNGGAYNYGGYSNTGYNGAQNATAKKEEPKKEEPQKEQKSTQGNVVPVKTGKRKGRRVGNKSSKVAGSASFMKHSGYYDDYDNPYYD